MASEMVERVAKAIWNSVMLQPACGPWPETNTASRQCCLRAASAAIGAMREPTLAMMKAGKMVTNLSASVPVARVTTWASNKWPDMIDAALSEAPINPTAEEKGR